MADTRDSASKFYLRCTSTGVFEVWHGPLKSDNNFRWAKFYGRTFDGGTEIWVWETSDRPDGLVEMPAGQMNG